MSDVTTDIAHQHAFQDIQGALKALRTDVSLHDLVEMILLNDQ